MADGSQVVSPLNAFSGGITRPKTGMLYRAGLSIVAFAMVLLPLIYVALIALAAWGVLLHLRYDTWIFERATGRSALIQPIVYVAPAVAGSILVFFMVKPFFAAKTKQPDPITLDPGQEGLLFAFVKKICALVGAPTPCRIDVDCQVNASASLSRGLWSRDLVVTIGLPLASGLEMRQFAGVLAHEFGHFAQGAGMRLTYVIRKINLWFARVVYERDEWDMKLERSARSADWRIGIILHAARGCVWLTRRILWALMHAGHAISCFMLRQMEYDADSYEAKLAGSDVFESTASRLRTLNAAAHFAYEDVRQSWAASRLPENLPLLIEHKALSLPAEVQQKLASSTASGKTGWFDTHPCDADRVQAVQRLKEPGVFRLSQPAAGLFANFEQLSKVITRHQYETHFELKFTDENLVSSQEMLRESTESAEADLLMRKFYGSVNISFKPLLTSGALPPINSIEALANWQKARETTDRLRAEAEKISTECTEQEKRLLVLVSAHALTKVGFSLDPKDFGLPEHGFPVGSAGMQERAIEPMVNTLSATLAQQLGRLEPFIMALRERVTLALGLVHASNSVEPQAAGELPSLVPLLAAVGAEMPRVREIGMKLRALMLLWQNRGNTSSPADVDMQLSQLMTELQSINRGIQQRLSQFAYPFPHPKGRLTAADYARSDKTADNELHRTYLDSDAHIDRLFALHYRLLGRVLACADAAEKVLAAPSQGNTVN